MYALDENAEFEDYQVYAAESRACGYEYISWEEWLKGALRQIAQDNIDSKEES